MNDDLYEVTFRLEAELALLSPEAQAAFYLVCAQALLPLYERFEAEVGWGDFEALRDGVDTVERWVLAAGQRPSAELVARLWEACPHADDFDSLDTGHAQCAEECVRYAVQIASGGAADPLNVEFVVEPVVVAVSMDLFNVSSPGGTAEGIAQAKKIFADPRVLEAIEFCWSAISRLKDAGADLKLVTRELLMLKNKLQPDWPAPLGSNRA